MIRCAQAVGDRLESELAALRDGLLASEYAEAEAEAVEAGSALADDALLDEWVKVHFRKRCVLHM